jgi:hypothetical protein
MPNAVDSHMKYFQNWHDLGEAGQKEKELPEEKFQTMFGVREVC